MNYYEVLMMARNSTTETQIDDLEKLMNTTINNFGGSITKMDRWGKLKLAFPIEYKDYAYFVLARFKVPKTKVDNLATEISNLLKIKMNAVIIRYVMLNLTEEQFTAPYKKPEAFIPAGPVSGKGGFNNDKGFGRKNSFSFGKSKDADFDDSEDTSTMA